MPRAQFRFDARGIQSNGVFSTPKKIQDLDEWLMAASGAAPGAPVTFHRRKPQYHKGWQPGPGDPTVTSGSILFPFQHVDGHKCCLVVDRKFDRYKR